ncbi:hypothetical protein SAMN06295879_2437 [Agreia bicolorata]|uniref:ABC-2 type transport system permease protein n=1 Tax=Agreia bicolorata TaxID=110935 RepID=A0A1T4Y7E1_9MICO|nr:hypothetical protein [Agreia bicolorata]SKA97742.1 hypothetical protein SAMN06295879_2437 [Agreia bicolorata]
MSRETAVALRAVRSIRRERAEGNSRGDVAYAVYAGIMVAAIVVVPILRAVVLYLAEPAASAALVAVGPAVSGTVFALACAAFVALGGVRGPAMLSSFLVFAVAGNGHPRRRTLLRPVARSVLALAVAGAGIALLVALVLVAVGSTSVAGAIVFAVAGALIGVVCGGCWLLGQRASAAVRAWIVVGVLATWAAWVVVPGSASVLPWGWFASLFPAAADVADAGLSLGGLGLLAAAALAVIPMLLDGLRGPALLAQAQRWQTAGTLAFTGDLAMAMGEFRAVPRRGRGLSAMGRGGRGGGRWGGLVWVFARRDLVGSLRTPARFVLACAGCLGFGLLIVVAVGASGVAVWIAACAAAIVGFLALGVWSDGFRHVAEVAAAPPLYGVSTLRLVGLHTVLPVVGGVVSSAAGVVVGVLLWGAVVWPALAAAVLSVLLLVLVRVYDSAKGPLPLTLMAPVPTPAGDASALVVAAWQADAAIIACVLVCVTAASVAASSSGGVAVAVGLGSVVAWMARRRILAD